ncbi:hypothetical protein B7H23_11055 [Notoacmeibacter marinus]|uniref:Polysaccharide chain length determinant N-terminal domain-containing protein n=1 Tax=Notoacmeibacter marinus TaxID=1876515 RepID=A0A231UXU9_9HYPH|nr:hypothetical protein [Notoacmeibacter marinus]OXT00631.1 hypothetical protein B7H23_11055 [Notoacmeibacter marinus]
MNAPIRSFSGEPFVEGAPMMDATASPPSAKGRRPFNPVRLARTPLRHLSARRLICGGRVGDAGRLPRYVFTIGGLVGAIWVPIALYLQFAPVSYTSSISLILPGTGVSSSVSLSEIGQASTSANSSYSSSSISPTVTYQKLVQSGRVIRRAAGLSGIEEAAFGRPRVKLVDQTSLMEVQMKGRTPDAARQRSEAVLSAFLAELTSLREDEIQRREASTTDTVGKYQEGVNAIRDRISALQSKTGLSSKEQFDGIVLAKETLLSQVAEGEAQLRDTARTVSTLARLLGITPDAAARTIKLHVDPQYAMLSKSLADETAKLASLARLYGPRHPEIVSVRDRHSGLQSQLVERAVRVTGLPADQLRDQVERAADGERGALLSRLVSEVARRDGQKARLVALRTELANAQSRVIDLIGVASELDKLNRDYKVAEAVFTSALARLNASKTDIFASYPMVQIAEPPSLPLEPSSPNRLLAILAGIVATLFATMGLVLSWLRRPLIDRLTGRLRNAGPATEHDAE